MPHNVDTVLGYVCQLPLFFCTTNHVRFFVITLVTVKNLAILVLHGTAQLVAIFFHACTGIFHRLKCSKALGLWFSLTLCRRRCCRSLWCRCCAARCTFCARWCSLRVKFGHLLVMLLARFLRYLRMCLRLLG